VQDVLKLLIRNRLLFKTRKHLFEIFALISEFLIQKASLKTEWNNFFKSQNLIFRESVRAAYEVSIKTLTELSHKIDKFLIQNKQFGKTFTWGIFEWVSHAKLQKEEIEVKYRLLTE